MLALVFDVLLPLVGIYDFIVLGHLASIVPSILFCYAIIKHDFLALNAIISRPSAAGLVLIIALFSYLLVYQATRFDANAQLLASLVTLAFWVLVSARFQQYLITTARRRFIKGWYNAQSAIDQFQQLFSFNQIPDRHELINTTRAHLFETLELEQSWLIKRQYSDKSEMNNGYQLEVNEEWQALSFEHALFQYEQKNRYQKD